MKKVKIQGQEFTLKGRKEVTYGAHKEVEDIKTEAYLAMMSNAEVAEMWLSKNKGGEEGDNGAEITPETLTDKIAKGDIKKKIITSQRAALSPEVEAIMLSTGMSRDEVYALSMDTVDELSKAANDALGGLVNFTKTSTTDTT